MKNEFRKPTEKENKEFDEANKKLDKVKEESKEKFKETHTNSNIEFKRKIFMKISDVDEEDAKWFKEFCDKNTDKKQFLGLKVIRMVMERVDPFLTNVLDNINDINERICAIEAELLKMPEEKEEGLVVPKTQGGKKNE